ncbi:MAG: cell division protein FtsA [Pseudomonadota bacterium]|nr:cell division protein FtsA [Pseudomonadota bacterium]MEE2820332.1 cell division protein FtsA [Pseudomonadota bacterium]
MSHLLVIDIGSSQITTAVAEITDDRRIVVRGLGRARSGGLKQGVVIQIDSVVDALVRSVAEANQMAGTKLTDPLVSVGGSHILGQDISGTVMLNHREVTDILVTQAMEQVQAQAQIPEREILSVIPRSFTLDSQTGLRLPQGMTGNRLDAHVHVITGAIHVINNLKKCLKLAGLEASVLVPSALAVSQLVLPDESELGVCVADIGIGTIDVMLISEGAPAWLQVMPMGGELLTHDLAVALKTPLGEAEDLKVQYGYAHMRFAPPAETVQVKKLADRPAETISVQQLTAFIQPRVEEIAEILGERLRQSGRFEEASTGIVLSGGTAALPGIAQVFESMLQCPCRVLKQAHQDGLDGLLQDPANAVLAGLLAYGCDQEVRPRPRWLGAQGSMFNRVRLWIQGNF